MLSKKRSACWEGMNGISFTREVSRVVGRVDAKFISYGLSSRVDKNDLRRVGGLYELMNAMAIALMSNHKASCFFDS